VFAREACIAVARSRNVIDVEFLPLGEHARPDRLRSSIQQRIDDADKHRYDAVLLLYGLCGNAGVGIVARNTRIVMPRAHDCATILLGSRLRFREIFGERPSTPFSSSGYMERGDYYLRTDSDGTTLRYGDEYAALVEQYGEDNAAYIWQTLHPTALESGCSEVVFIEIEETRALGHEQRFRAKALQEGRKCTTVQGSLRLIDALCGGDWNSDDFVVIQPGCSTKGVYDWNEIIREVPENAAGRGGLNE